MQRTRLYNGFNKHVSEQCAQELNDEIQKILSQPVIVPQHPKTFWKDMIQIHANKPQYKHRNRLHDPGLCPFYNITLQYLPKELVHIINEYYDRDNGDSITLYSVPFSWLQNPIMPEYKHPSRQEIGKKYFMEKRVGKTNRHGFAHVPQRYMTISYLFFGRMDKQYYRLGDCTMSGHFPIPNVCTIINYIDPHEQVLIGLSSRFPEWIHALFYEFDFVFTSNSQIWPHSKFANYLKRVQSLQRNSTFVSIMDNNAEYAIVYHRISE